MKDIVLTINGEIHADNLGYILPHDHNTMFLERPPADQHDSVYRKIYEHYVSMYKELIEKYGCNTVVDPITTFWMDTDLVKQISRDSGMNIVVATGWYMNYTPTRNSPTYRPDEFKNSTVGQLAQRMVDDLTIGIKDTGIRAGVMKVGIFDMQLEDGRKLLRAAAIAQKETGVSIITHTVRPRTRMGLLNFLEGAGVDPARIYISHPDSGGSDGAIVEAMLLLERGCNVIYTNFGINSKDGLTWDYGPLPKYFSTESVAGLVYEGLADQVLISIDYYTHYTVEEGLYLNLTKNPDRSMIYMFTHSVPLLKQMGISQENIDRIMKHNPKRMLLY